MRRDLHRKGARTPAAIIDLDFRPRSHWDHADPASAILQNIKGRRRREMVREVIEGNAAPGLGGIEPELLEDEIDDDARAFLGRLHPLWMGGEYLPGYHRGGVEIARIALESTTGDVISFRARRGRAGSLIRYRVVDEYQTEYTTTRLTARRPLSLRELIRLIDETDSGQSGSARRPFVETIIEDCADGNVEFAKVGSDVYPYLARYYGQRLAAWAAARSAENEEPEV